MTERPADPDVLYTRFTAHLETCKACTARGECPEGQRLLTVWGEADLYWARIQAETVAAVAALEDEPLWI